MQINEIFLSIQAESVNLSRDISKKFGVGVPTIFIRFNHCNLKCTYPCDTMYTWHPKYMEPDIIMTPQEIINKVREVGGPYKVICITGGSPELQPMGEMHALIRGLKELNYTVSIEASGTAGRDAFFGADSVVMDIKGPSAGPTAMKVTADNKAHVRTLGPYDQLKFLVRDREDFDWMVNWLTETQLLQIENHPLVLVSPMFDKKGTSNAAEIVKWILESKLDLVLNFQIHKIIWSHVERGV